MNSFFNCSYPSLVESDKDLDATTGTDLNSDEENQSGSLENSEGVDKSQVASDGEKNAGEESGSQSLKHKLADDADDEGNGEDDIERSAKRVRAEGKPFVCSAGVKVFRTISSAGSEAESEEEEEEEEEKLVDKSF